MVLHTAPHREGTRPRISVKDATFAKVIVGTQKDCFTVHQDLLTHHSPFFRAALTGRFEEARSKTVILAEEQPDIFEYFVHWLYYQRLPTPKDSAELFAHWDDTDNEDIKSGNVIMLYVFCDKYNVPELKRQLLDELWDHVLAWELPSLENASFAYSNLAEKDPLCRFLVDIFCYWGDNHLWTHCSIGDLSPVFLTKLMLRYTEFAQGERDRTCTPELCDYHGHEKIEDRVACEESRDAEG